MPKHGTYARYQRECRCSKCKAACRDYQRVRRAKLRAKPMPQKAHGTTSGYYDYGCGCPQCAAARRRTDENYWRRKLGVPA